MTATLHHYGAEPRAHVRVEMRVGKAQSATGEPTFRLNTVSQRFVDLAPGQNVVSFPYRFDKPGGNRTHHFH